MPELRPNVPPPPNYYADNLTRLLRAVSEQYNDILHDPERDQLRRVLELSVGAKRLYARVLTRKGPLLRVDSLAYREVPDLPAALAELEAKGLVRLAPLVPADQMLAMLTRVELDALFPYARARAARKETQVVLIASRYPDQRIRDKVNGAHPLCMALELDFIATLQILFFGDARADFSTFVLEDLGVVRFERYPLDPRNRQFLNRCELDDFIAMRALREGLRALEARWQTRTAIDALAGLWAARERRLLERVRAGLINQLGRCAERAGEFDIALSAYARTTRAPGRERRARLLQRLGDRSGVTATLDAIERAPFSSGERQFARQFRVGGRRRAAALPERVLRLPAPPVTRVEQAALDALTCGAGTGRHLENLLPLGMLGLAFWDVVFAPVEAAFVNPYQNRPADLYWGDFRRARAQLIDSRFDALVEPDAIARDVCATAQAKRGISNALVDWRALDPHVLECATTAVPGTTWLAIFDYMLDDLEQTRTGFPDLALFFGPQRFQFVEVKGPGDQLRREQRLWFEFFARADIPALVLWVEWS